MLPGGADDGGPDGEVARGQRLGQDGGIGE
jgi:hypothetical protein